MGKGRTREKDTLRKEGTEKEIEKGEAGMMNGEGKIGKKKTELEFCNICHH